MTRRAQQLAALAIPALLGIPTLLAGECEKIDRLPASAQQVLSESLSVPQAATLSKGWEHQSPASTTYVRLVPGDSGGLWSMHTTLAGGSGSPLCVTGGSVRSGLPAIYRLDNPSSTKPIKIHLVLTPGTSLTMTMYSEGIPASAPDRPALPDKVGIPVELFVLEGAKLANDIDKHFTAATEIWSKAGIVLRKGRVRRLSKAESEKLLEKGTKAALDTYLGCVQRFDEPGYSEREQLFKLKSKSGAMAVFFVTTTTQSQVEREFTQVYMDNDPMGASLGRTLAHELGHLLLGEGHTGGEQRQGPCNRSAAESAFQPKQKAPWTSGLMRAGNESNATDISDADAATARKNALSLPGAVFW